MDSKPATIRSPGSRYATPAIATRAVDLVAPMIEAVRGNGDIVGSGFLYVVVMDPALGPSDCAFGDAILHERAFGDRALWDADYAAFAREKARLSWLTRLDGRTVQNERPELIRAADPPLLIGGVCHDGIVVAASGAFPVYDEAFARSIAVCLRALAHEAREAETAALSRPAG